MALDYANTFRKLQGFLKSSSFWALSDQGVLSLGTFTTNIVLMRVYKTDPQVFAAFMLLVSTMALMNNLHASLITYPLSVKGAAASDVVLRRLASSSLLNTLILMLPFQLVMLFACWWLKHEWLFPYVAITMIAWQVQETTRRSLMAHLRNAAAVWGDSISYLGQAAIVALICLHHVPGLHEIFMVMTGTSLLAAAVQMMQLRVPLPKIADAKALAVDGWYLGRWLLMSNGLVLFTYQGIAWMVYQYHPNDTAAYFALATLLGVSHPVMFGISGLIVPGVAKTRHQEGVQAATRYAVKLGIFGGVLLAPFYLFLMIAPAFAIRLIAGEGSPTIQFTQELRWFVLEYIVIYISVVSTALLNGLEASRTTFFGQLANAVLSITIRAPLTAMSTMAAAVWSGIITYSAQIVVNWYGLRQYTAPPVVESDDEPALAVVEA